MQFSKRTLVLPLLCISIIIAGMTQQAFAASVQPSVKSATTGSSATEELMQRITDRAMQRRKQTADALADDTPLLRRSGISSSRRSTSSSPVLKPAPSNESYTSAVFRLVNEERAKNGLPAYTYNTTLESSAIDYSDHMRETNCFSHTACGSTLKERLHASGYYKDNGRSYSYGENIARGQTTATEVMKDWLHSPSHRDAILSSKFKEIGIGKSGTYWTQHFGAVR